MAAPSKEEYLKKYLSVNAEEKKKKKKKKPGIAPAKIVKSRIVDDDVDFKSLLPENLGNTLEEDVGDNEPVVADFIDERPEHVKLIEKYRTSGAWKTLGDDDEKGDSQRHDSDSDQSPHRKKRHDSDSDQSPPRRKRHDSDSDQSPPRRKRHDSDSDQSSPRKQSIDSKHKSPLRRQRHGSDSDQSPLRRQRHNSDSDQSPPRRQRHNSDSDQSPPRRQRQDSDSDQSPPRRRRQDSDSDQSPPRKKSLKSKNLSPVRRKHGNSDSDCDARKQKLQRQSLSNTKSVNESSDKKEKTLSGKRAGLSSAQDMRKEAEELKSKEEARFREISDERLGKGAATVFRDKSGKKRNIAEEKARETEEAKKKAKEDEKFQQWGKGLKQIEEQSRQVQDALHEASKPLARYKDDEDLDQMLRDMDRAEDPMLAFITKKKKKNAGPPQKEKPRYKGPAPPPNRFGILPGYRWDGVDRSNGFEKQVYSKQADKKATSEQAYKWSVEDM